MREKHIEEIRETKNQIYKTKMLGLFKKRKSKTIELNKKAIENGTS